MARFTTLASALVCLSACTAAAGWEDTGTTPTQQPRQIVAAPSADYNGASPQESTLPKRRGVITDDLYTTFFDTPTISDTWIRAAYDFESNIANSDEGTAIIELDSHFGIAEWFDVLNGDVTFSVNPSFRILTDDCGVSILPNALLSLPADFKWTWRFLNGWSLQIGAAPGFYTDVNADAVGSLGDALSIPFSGCFYYAFNSSTSARFGVEIRPDWDMVAMPLLGICWAPSDIFRMDIGAPRSIVLLDFESFDIFAGAEWRSFTYGMAGKDGKPDSFTLEDISISAGLGLHLADESRISLEAGMLVNRSMAYEIKEGKAETDVDPTPFFAITFGSNF